MARLATRFLGAILAAVLLAAAPAASAAGLDEYRAQGVIAERYDGLVELRGGDAPAEARRLVQEVNAKRRELYGKRAESQGVPVAEVGKVYAQEILQRAPQGTYFRKPDGSYIRK